MGLVIFDLDGTLFEGALATVPAVADACRGLGLEPPAPAEIRAFIGEPPAKFQAWLGSLYAGRRARELLVAVADLELRYLTERGALYPGVREMLAGLREGGVRLAICSNGAPPYVERVVSDHGLADLFDAVRCRQSSKDTKSLMMRGLLARVDRRPAVGVGDRREDVEAAHENGLVAIGAGYGYGSPEELSGADAVAGTVGELAGLARRHLARG